MRRVPTTKLVLAVAVAALMAGGTAGAAAQALSGSAAQPYPSRTVKIVTAGQPGIISDIIARLLAERLEQLWATPVVVENRSGAGGTIAAEAVARAPADGYTLFVGGHSNLVLAQVVGKDLRYDPQRDFAPIGRVATVPFALAVNPTVPVRSVGELVEYARARPGKMTFATNGPGTMSQLGVELLVASTRVDVIMVPYKGLGSAMNDVLGARVDAIFTDYVGIAPHVKSGTLRLLAVAGARRIPTAPDVPSIGEQGVSGYAVSGWYGLLAPVGTPPEILAALASALESARRTPEMQRRLAELDCEPVEDTPAGFRALIKSELEKFSAVARAAGSKPD